MLSTLRVHCLVTLTILTSCVPALHAQDRVAQIDSYLRNRAGIPFSGVVLIARGSDILMERAYGFADADLGVPIRTDMRFGIGSLTKPMVAAAVMRLVDSGVLKLNDSVCNYVRQCPANWRPVALRHLLSHTSGIADRFGDMAAAPVDSTRAIMDAVIAAVPNDTLRFVPGERFAYSNFNYCLLGYVMEVATGSTWSQIMREQVFQPAGMLTTEYDDVWSIMPGRVRGYDHVGGRIRHIKYHDHAAFAAGGLLSSARDVQRFGNAVMNGNLLSESSRVLSMTPGHGDYGLGWQIITAFGRTLRNHTGGTNGFASHIAYWDDGTSIIVLSNLERESAKATACDIAAVLFGLRMSDRSSGESPCRALP